MSENITEFVGRGLVVAVVIASLVTLRKWVPASSVSHGGKRLDTEELEEQFMPLRARVIGGMLCIGILFAIGSWYLLSRTNVLLARSDGTATFTFLPQPAIWWFFPGFGAPCLCWELTLQIWALFGDRETVNLFSDWTNQSPTFWGANYGMDSRKILRWMTLLIALPIFVFTALALNMHATISSQQIRDCGYAFRPCETYKIADIRRITEIQGIRTKDGELSHRAGIVFDFADGRRWSSAGWGDWHEHADPVLADYMAKRTGLEPGFALTEEDIPPVAIDPTQP